MQLCLFEMLIYSLSRGASLCMRDDFHIPYVRSQSCVLSTCHSAMVTLEIMSVVSALTMPVWFDLAG